MARVPFWYRFFEPQPYGHGPKARTPSKHPTKIGSKMGGAPKTPKWDQPKRF